MNQPEHPDLHAQCPELLPWLVNGTLPAALVRPVRAHLETCDQCREDYESQLRLYAAMRAEDSLVFAAEPSFQKLMARIEGLEAAGGALPAARRVAEAASRSRESSSPDRARTRRREGAHSWALSRRVALLTGTLAVAVVLESIGLVLEPRLASRATLPDAAGAPYSTLTAPQPQYGGTERVRVVFRGQVPLDRLAGLLRGVDAHIVDGPTEANVYTLGFAGALPRAALDQRIASLRASSDVVFAEPVYAGEHAR